LSTVDIIDEMFVVADRMRVRAIVCAPATWQTWFPDLTLTTYQDRGASGVRWEIDGEMSGTAEVWLEDFGDGTIVHTYIRAEQGSGRRTGRRLESWVRRHYALPLKGHLLAVKDEIEHGRSLGEPRVALAERVVSRPIDTDDLRASRDGRPDDLEHPDRC
jgi:hypothetical protein